jgi:rfaE bifunctional protein nucleotidyltransferase chain/domain
MQNFHLDPSEKVISREQLADIIVRLKEQGKTIVTTNGSFDLLHIGHVTMLQEAKSLGDVLIVGLNSDASIKCYKGQYRPICPQSHRASMLAALACTDYITIFDELTPIDLLKIIQPHIHVNSPEHGKDCVEREVVEQHGGHIHLAQLVEGLSTTELIERVVEVTTHTPCRGIFINASELFTKTKGVQDLFEEDREVLQQFTQQGFQIFVFTTFPVLEGEVNEGLEQPLFTLYSTIPSTYAMLEQAVIDWDVILAKSFIISRDMADIQAGREANCKTILLNAHLEAQEHISSAAGPHIIVESLQKTVPFISR